MPMITIPVTSGYDSITRRVSQAVARDVLVLCNIDTDVPVYIPGEFQNTVQPGGRDMPDKDTFDSYESLEATVTDTLRRSSAMSMNLMSNEEPPCIEDRVLGISVRPIYFESDLTIDFKYTAPTKQKAEFWIKQMVLRLAENRGSLNHEVTYDIALHDGLLGMLANFHDLREKIAGYGDSFPEYFAKIALKETTAIGARDGDVNKLLPVMTERGGQIGGYFDFGDVPQERKVDNNVTWEIEFQYRVLYKRWTHFFISYPLMIHQQWISSKYFSTKSYYGVEEIRKRGPIGVRAFDAMDGYLDYFPAPADGVRFPGFDDWIPPRHSQPPFSVPGMTWLLQLDPADPQDLLNLTQIPEVRFTLQIDTYLRQMYKTLHRKNGGLCFLTLYRNDLPLNENALTVDKDLNVRATVPLDVRCSYHLRLSFCTNYSLFTKAALRSMEDHPIASLHAFQTILPTLDVEHGLSVLMDGLYMEPWYIEWFYGYLRDHGIGWDNGSGNEGGSNSGRDNDQNTSGPGSGGNNGGGSGSGNGRRPGGRYVQFLAIIAMRDDNAA